MTKMRWLVALAVLCLVVAAAAVAYAAGKAGPMAPRVVRAQGFELVDPSGKLWGRLSAPGKRGEGGAGLVLFGADGKERLFVGLRGNGEALIRLRDTTGSKSMAEINVGRPPGDAAHLALWHRGERAEVTCGEYGSSVMLLRPDGTLARTSVDSSGMPALDLAGGNSEGEAVLSVQSEGPWLTLQGRDRAGVIDARVGSGGEMSLSMFGKEGSAYSGLSADPNGCARLAVGEVDIRSGDGTPSLLMYDDKGKARVALGKTVIAAPQAVDAGRASEWSLLFSDENQRVIWSVPSTSLPAQDSGPADTGSHEPGADGRCEPSGLE
jgi:hypothetical protein